MCYAIQENMVDRDTNQNGPGYMVDDCPTLNTVDKHAVAFQASGDRDNPGISVSDMAYCLAANPMSDRGQAVCFQQNQRDEVRDMGEQAGALTAQPGVHNQNYLCYPETARTLAARHDSSPCVDRGQNVVAIDCRNMVGNEELSATLQAKNEGGFSLNFVNPVVYENSTWDGISPTLDASYYKGPGARGGKEREFLAIENDKPLRKYIVRRLTPTECQRLQGFPNVAEVNVGQMTRDEIVMLCLSEGLIRVDFDTGKVYGIRGPGGLMLSEWRELRGSSQNGYVVHTLNISGTKKQVKAHRIVWIAAHGAIPDGMVVDHINSDKTDNRLCNLQILSPEDNSTKARQDGLYMTGEKSATAKISDDDKKTIQFLYWHTDMLQKRIGEMFGLCQQRISQIVHEECGWCEGLGGSDSAIYKAYGNGLALPCAYDVMQRIARFVEREEAPNGA